MTKQELTTQKSRIEEFERITKRLVAIGQILKELEEKAHGVDIFTGNAGDARKIANLTVNLSRSSRMPNDLNILLTGLNISAHRFASFIRERLNEEAAQLHKERDAL